MVMMGAMWNAILGWTHRSRQSICEFSQFAPISSLRTLPGLLKVIQICFNFLCFMCVLIGGPAYYAGVGGATFVSVFGFIISLTLLMLYLFHVVDQWPQIPWIVCVSVLDYPRISIAFWVAFAGDDLLLFLDHFLLHRWLCAGRCLG